MRFNLGIVLYNPTEGNIKSIIQYANNCVWEKVFIFYNSEVSYDIPGKNVIKLGEGKNLGLSIPYNQFLEKSQDVDYLCVLDQDSKYEAEEISKMVAYINKNSEALKEVGIIAPRSYAAVSKIVERKDATTEADYVINSGSFVNMAFIKRQKLSYDEHIFLDGVDVDFCWNIRRNKGNVLIYEDSVLYQSLGESMNGHKCNHSPTRFYYIVSARKYMYKKYKGNFVGGCISCVKTIGTILKIILNEDDKCKKIKQCIKGQFAKL